MSDRRPVLLVTGGSRGIGAEIVRRAAARGYDVAFSYTQARDAAERLAAELTSTGARLHAVHADVADAGAVKSLFEEAEAALGPIDALVNNAGITGRISRFAEIDAATLQRVMDVNVLGTMFCAQEAVRRWLERGTKGVMVNVSSSAATTGSPGEYVYYAASKGAVDAFTIGLAREVAAAGIRVTAVAPGTTHTDIHAAGGEPDRPARVASRIPLGRAAEREEIAEAVLWMLSPQASYVTGTVLRVAGGL